MSFFRSLTIARVQTGEKRGKGKSPGIACNCEGSLIGLVARWPRHVCGAGTRRRACRAKGPGRPATSGSSARRAAEHRAKELGLMELAGISPPARTRRLSPASSSACPTARIPFWQAQRRGCGVGGRRGRSLPRGNPGGAIGDGQGCEHKVFRSADGCRERRRRATVIASALSAGGCRR